MIRVDKIKEVRQLKYLNGFSIREISRRAYLSRNTVRKILRTNATKFTYQRQNNPQPVRGSIKETIEVWIAEDLQLRPKYRRTAIRMHELLRDAYGYSGSYETVLRCFHQAKQSLKPKKQEACIPLEYLTGRSLSI